MERTQYTAHNKHQCPEFANSKYMEYEEVSTGLSKAICTYGYKEDGKWIPLKQVRKKLQEQIEELKEDNRVLRAHLEIKKQMVSNREQKVAELRSEVARECPDCGRRDNTKVLRCNWCGCMRGENGFVI